LRTGNRAMKLSGWSGLRVLGAHFAAGDIPEHDRVIDDLRATLGQEELDRLRADGSRLSLEEAVDLALTPG
jgi:hypothetical protein